MVKSFEGNFMRYLLFQNPSSKSYTCYNMLRKVNKIFIVEHGDENGLFVDNYMILYFVIGKTCNPTKLWKFKLKVQEWNDIIQIVKPYNN